MLVIGATGGTGREVVRQAVARGLDVTVLVRGEAPADLPAAVRVLKGDVRDAAAIAAALDGQDAVVSALGVKLGQKPGRERSESTAALVAAMEQAGVARLVSVSSVGVGPSLATMTKPARTLWPRMVGQERLDEVARADASITGSSLEWTLVQPPRLVESTKTDAVTVGPATRVAFGSQLSRAQLATVLLNALADDTTIGRTLIATAG